MRLIAAWRCLGTAVAAGRRRFTARTSPPWRLLGQFALTSFLALAPVEAIARGGVSHTAVVWTIVMMLAVFAAFLGLTGRRIADHDRRHAQALEAASAREDDLRQELAAQAASEDVRRREAVARMADAVESGLGGTLDPLTVATTQIRHISETIAAGAERLGGNAVVSSEAADIAAGSARQLAETADHLNTSIQQVSDQVGEATGIAKAAVAAGKVAKDVIDTLSGQAASIQSVVELIGSIAAQTNLLALNATIEAARAGEAGRGFAVVANEVKALARKTAHSTATIGETISAIRASNLQAVDAVQQMINAVAAMDAIAATIAVSIDDQRVATAQIAERVNETVDKAQALVDRINEVTAEVGNNFECAAEVHLTADAISTAMSEMVAAFQQTVAHAVRTATPDANRRVSPRIPVDQDCLVELDGIGKFAGRMLDVSQGGVRLRIATPVTGLDRLTAGLSKGAIELDAEGPKGGFIVEHAKPDESGWELRLRLTEPPEDWDKILREAA